MIILLSKRLDLKFIGGWDLPSFNFIFDVYNKIAMASSVLDFSSVCNISLSAKETIASQPNCFIRDTGKVNLRTNERVLFCFACILE